MQECKLCLPLITTPTLIIQGNKDPVVKPESADKILKMISSDDKHLQNFKSDRHVIVLGKGNKRVFNSVHSFIDRLLKEKG